MGRRRRKKPGINGSSTVCTPVEIVDISENMVKNDQTAEIGRLKNALQIVLEDSNELRAQIRLLEKKQDDLVLATPRVQDNTNELKHNIRVLERNNQILQMRLQRSENRYQALASSKLGQLTLAYWNWSKNHSGPMVCLGGLFFVRWLFNKLPPVQLETPQNQEQIAEQKIPFIAATAQNKDAVVTMPMASTEMSVEQEGWIHQFESRIQQIPESNGCRYYEKLPYRIGLICDEFFYESICDAADFQNLTPDNWRDVLRDGLDACIIVSAWRGLHEEWKGVANISTFPYHPKRQTMNEIIAACKEQGVPTIFYSKEDPPNYELFLDFAKHCDYVFTSAEECIPYYKQDCNRDQVDAVCFGINPQMHNPIGGIQENKEKTVLFSGSWMLKYPDRCAELAEIFDGVLQSKHQLHIIDRNYPQNKRFAFPEPYFAVASPAIPHKQLQKVHKCFDWAININSVKGSNTMFANRAFELQANGVLLISNFSTGVNSLLPTVFMSGNASEVVDILETFTPEELYQRQVAGVRSVMTGHTCYDRLNQLLQYTKLDTVQPQRSILVIVDEKTTHMEACFAHQSYAHKTMVEARDVTAEMMGQHDMVTWFHISADYGVFYLEDMANGFKYTACDYITKDSWYHGGEKQQGVEHNYVNHMGSKYRTLFWIKAFEEEVLLTMDGGMELSNGYSIDPFHYNEDMIEQIEEKHEYLLSVVVPVYNNGRHLYGKCFASLQRSSMFKEMEIIFVDDGSTDELTLKIEADLVKMYPNVSIHRFDDGGSGSASRPRNYGVQLATAPYVTFLDPDNEAVCDGYSQLYRAAVEKNLDVAMGNMYKCDVETRLADYYSIIKDGTGTDFFEDGFGDNLIHVNFMSASIQAMVMKKELIQRTGIEQVVGAAGQDTLFSWQLLHNAKRIQVFHLPIHIYYAQTAGSVTNVVGPKFFAKLLKLQQPKVEWLCEAGLIESFMEKRYDYYTKNWIFKKLSQTAEDAKIVCAKLVAEICNCYGAYYHNSDALISDFIKLCDSSDYVAAVQMVREAFPIRIKRPMRTREEILDSITKKKLNVQYEKVGSEITFTNHSDLGDGSSYAWVILRVGGNFDKAYSGKYNASNQFTYDFANLEQDLYKVKAFIKRGQEKISEEVIVIKVLENREIVIVG